MASKKFGQLFVMASASSTVRGMPVLRASTARLMTTRWSLCPCRTPAGVRTVSELVGRSDFLKVRDDLGDSRASLLDLHQILDNPYVEERQGNTYDPADQFDFKLEDTLDMKVLLKEFKKNLKTGAKKQVSLKVSSTDRSLGTILGSEITKSFGESLPEDTFTVNCTGGGGQSFGAFVPKPGRRFRYRR